MDFSLSVVSLCAVNVSWGSHVPASPSGSLLFEKINSRDTDESVWHVSPPHRHNNMDMQSPIYSVFIINYVIFHHLFALGNKREGPEKEGGGEATCKGAQ